MDIIVLCGNVKTRWASSGISASTHPGDGLESFLIGEKISLDPGPLLVGGSFGFLMGAYTRVRRGAQCPVEEQRAEGRKCHKVHEKS